MTVVILEDAAEDMESGRPEVAQHFLTKRVSYNRASNGDW
jgi:hypothetical protein